MAVVDISNTFQMSKSGEHIDNTDVYNSNRNLLDNPWFRIDQRSVSGTITSGYIADRWTITYGSGGVQASRTADSITVKPTNDSSHGDIAQRMEKSLFDFLVGKTVTASVMRSDWSVISKSFTFQSGVNSIDVGHDLDGNLISIRVYQTSTYQNVQFWKWKTAGTFRAVKLELGSYSTLANDVPPDYEEELRKCMYYFQRIRQQNSYTLCVGFGEAMNSTTNIRITIPTAVPMRHQASAMSAVPTGTGTMYIVGNGQLLPVTAVAGLGVTGNAVVVNVTVSTAGAYNHIYGLRFTNNSTYIDLSADL